MSQQGKLVWIRNFSRNLSSSRTMLWTTIYEFWSSP